MKIIIANPSPYARKARVALREKDIVFEEIIDVPWNTNTLTKGINPQGKIPILLNGNHEPLFDSKVIIQYLDYYKPQPLLYPKNPKDNISVRLVETVADGVCDAIVLIFLENSRKKTLKSKDWIQRQEKKFSKELNIFPIILKERTILQATILILQISVDFHVQNTQILDFQNLNGEMSIKIQKNIGFFIKIDNHSKKQDQQHR